MSSLLSFKHFSKNKYDDLLIIAHGLFGSKTNWMSTAKFLSENLRLEIIVVDLRNHGSSFWSDYHDYLCMAEDLIKLTESFSKRVNIIGHSMGGKAAMVASISRPEIFKKLVVVDISPVNYAKSEFINYIKLLKDLNLNQIKTRKEADLKLKEKIVDRNIRLFLLQNLYIDENNNYNWKINLESLKKNIENIKLFPKIQNSFKGRTLFIKGKNSNYIQEKHLDLINNFFPNHSLREIANSGHWPHIEQPDLFRKELLTFLYEDQHN